MYDEEQQIRLNLQTLKLDVTYLIKINFSTTFQLTEKAPVQLQSPTPTPSLRHAPNQLFAKMDIEPPSYAEAIACAPTKGSYHTFERNIICRMAAVFTVHKNDIEPRSNRSYAFYSGYASSIRDSNSWPLTLREGSLLYNQIIEMQGLENALRQRRAEEREMERMQKEWDEDMKNLSWEEMIEKSNKEMQAWMQTDEGKKMQKEEEEKKQKYEEYKTRMYEKHGTWIGVKNKTQMGEEQKKIDEEKDEEVREGVFPTLWSLCCKYSIRS